MTNEKLTKDNKQIAHIMSAVNTLLLPQQLDEIMTTF